ncbi:MAG: AAA family ATPase [Clostridia bacterium]|nr:AAA family ATPase [Clostridia bacterium]
MASIQESALLARIMGSAQQLAQDNRCSAVTRDLIIAAAFRAIRVPDAVLPEEKKELQAVDALLKQHTEANPGCRTKAEQALVNAWAGKDVPMSEKMILMAVRGKAVNAVRAKGDDCLTADVLLEVLLKEKSEAFRSLLGQEEAPAPQLPWLKKEPQQPQAPVPEAETPSAAPAALPDAKEVGLAGLTRRVKEMQQKLEEKVMGQTHAVSTLVTGYFQAELQSAIDQKRKSPRATFLFAGPPGVGKTFLSETVAECLGLPFRRFDMSEYSGPNSADELSGSDANYKASSEGQLTGFVAKNPHCVLLFDEIEKANPETLHLFLQVLDAGRLRDNRTDKEVSFRDAICIFTTNAGRGLYENSESSNLSGLSRDVIVDALARDINPRTREPYFPAALCSRFAAGNVVMFNHLDASALHKIGERRLLQHFANLQESMGIQMEMDEYLSTALLLSEGAAADARSVKSRADAFFGGELFELLRLSVSPDRQENESTVRRIHFSVDLENTDEKVRALFVPKERVHALVYSARRLPVEDAGADMPILHYVQTVADARRLMKEEDIRFLVCDLMCERNPQAAVYLNKEDVRSEGREFLYAMLERYPDMPVLLMEGDACRYTQEERDSFLWRGVWGFIDMDRDDKQVRQKLSDAADVIFRQHSLSLLARANRLIRFETAQCLMNGGEEAEIVLFDLKLHRAVKAEDSENVMSMFSTPEETFDDIIGAQDAKAELKFFASCLKEPKKYARRGAAAPKGVLLWGPPGTGKTMLAKAFAHESGATFIATEGNRFFKGVVGQGADMVHRLFATARRYAPAVIFIDEVDVIAKARTGRDTDMANDSEQILTALFAEMDGFSTDADRPVFVLGATNYSVDGDAAMKLDGAFLRRFDRRILIDLPDAADRKRFLEMQLKKRPLFSITPQGIDSIADRSAGMSLAQLKGVIEMAMRQALRTDAEKVDDGALEEAFETFVSGDKREWNKETVLRTARHETGHVMISWLTGEKPAYVTITSRSNFGGYMQYASQEDKMGFTRQELLGRIRTALGGRAAEIVCYGKEAGLSTGASGDLQKATDIARCMLCQYGMDEQFGLAVMPMQEERVHQAVNALLKEQLQQAVQLLEKHRAVLDEFVDELMKHSNLREKDIDRILGNVL